MTTVRGSACHLTKPCRTELFKKAFDHISDRIDQVYKDLTKGKAAPMGGVAYLNLEDSEVQNSHSILPSVTDEYVRNLIRVASTTMPCPQ